MAVRARGAVGESGAGGGRAGETIVGAIVARKRAEIAALLRAPGREAVRRAAAAMPPPAPFVARLRRPDRIAVIAEFKRASPRVAAIRRGADPVELVLRYRAAGADAVSVLTDAAFDGTLGDLRRAHAADPHTALLRKDFLLDPIQVDEARAAGASAVLLIAALLDGGALDELCAAARDAGLEALVEVHDEDEVARALAAGAPAIGVNHRDLRTFAVDLGLSARLRPLVPADVPVVAESGLRVAADVARCRAARCDAVLVGEALMAASDPGAALRALLGEAELVP
jgi:indole-3-glycerol phosphate synthase